jgi:hypothetical protein
VHLAETTTCSCVGGCFAAQCAAGECVHEVNQALRIAPSRMRLMNYELECSLGRLDATRRIVHGVWFGRLRVDISRIASLEHVGYGFVQPMDGSNTSPFIQAGGLDQRLLARTLRSAARRRPRCLRPDLSRAPSVRKNGAVEPEPGNARSSARRFCREKVPEAGLAHQPREPLAIFGVADVIA